MEAIYFSSNRTRVSLLTKDLEVKNIYLSKLSEADNKYGKELVNSISEKAETTESSGFAPGPPAADFRAALNSRSVDLA